MRSTKLPSKFAPLWKACQPYFQQGRPGDREHARQIILGMVEYQGQLKFDKEVLVPVAMFHDIGHAMILPQHLHHVTGTKKIKNGKLVHMLVGAKIAHEILHKTHYNKKKGKEIIEIVGMHDFDQIDTHGTRRLYNTTNKKIFHDFDLLDRYNENRIGNMSNFIKSDTNTFKILEDNLKMFFYQEFKKRASNRLKKMKAKNNPCDQPNEKK